MCKSENGECGHAAFAEVRGGGVGVWEEEFAEDGKGFGARGFEEGGEVECGGGGGHAVRVAPLCVRTRDGAGVCWR